MKTAFLDLDGTLLDSTKRHGAVLANCIRELGLPTIDTDDFVSYKSDGFTTKDYLILKKGFDEDVAKELSALWVKHIEDDKYLALDTWFEDAAHFVSDLCEKGFKCIIITSRQREDAVMAQIDSFRERQRIFDAIVVLPGKRDKSLYMKDRLTDGSIMVGDTEVDYDAGTECGIDTYMVNRGFRSKSFWDKRNIKSYTRLNEIITEL